MKSILPFLLFVVPAFAADNPSSYITHLGEVSILTYTTRVDGGLNLFATVQENAIEPRTPVRFETMLAQGQKVTVSIPRALNALPLRVHFIRKGDHVEVHEEK